MPFHGDPSLGSCLSFPGSHPQAESPVPAVPAGILPFPGSGRRERRADLAWAFILIHLSLSRISRSLLALASLSPAPPRSLSVRAFLSRPSPSPPTLPTPPQVKVWFQNRRTKQKKDQSRDSEKRSSSTSESFATCNILRLLEQGRLLSVPAPPSLLSPTSNPVPNPAGSAAGLATAGPGLATAGPGLATAGPASPGLGGGSSPPKPAPFGLHVPSLAASSSSSSSSPSPRLPGRPLCFGAPLLGSLHDLPGAYGPGASAFEPYTRLERKDNSIPSKKPSP